MQSFRSLTRVDSLDLPDGARVYKVPKSVSAIGIVGLIVFGIFCIPTLLFPALEPNKNTRPLVIVRVPIFAGFRSSLPLVPARLQARRDCYRGRPIASCAVLADRFFRGIGSRF